MSGFNLRKNLRESTRFSIKLWLVAFALMGVGILIGLLGAAIGGSAGTILILVGLGIIALAVFLVGGAF